MTAVATPVLAPAATVASTSPMCVPPLRARCTASWITGPSISGSEYGRPISTTSAPPSAIATAAAIAPSPERPDAPPRDATVLVAPPGQVDYQHRFGAELPAQSQRTGQRVGRLDRRDD